MNQCDTEVTKEKSQRGKNISNWPESAFLKYKLQAQTARWFKNQKAGPKFMAEDGLRKGVGPWAIQVSKKQ